MEDESLIFSHPYQRPNYNECLTCGQLDIFHEQRRHAFKSRRYGQCETCDVVKGKHLSTADSSHPFMIELSKRLLI